MFHASALVLLLSLVLLTYPAVGGPRDEYVKIEISAVPENAQREISKKYMVSHSGTIKLPRLGDTQAAGFTCEQLARRIEAAYKAAGVFEAPVVTVSPSRYERTDAPIAVGGYVRRPGPIPFDKGMTIWNALQAAGGENEFGDISRTELYRDGKLMVLDLSQTRNWFFPVENFDSINVPLRRPNKTQ